MVGNDENIYVEFDYQNVALIDPNKVIDAQGNVKERTVKNENLIMYANLECSLIPRTRMALGIDNNFKKNLFSIATINFLNPGGSGYLTDEHYDEITGLDTVDGKGVNQQIETANSNPSGYLKTVTNNVDTQLLGITEISVRQRVIGVFEVEIMMEDYHGRALFEKGENSPYACFFSFPYPMFFLTIKGYYGKAAQHQLALESFNAQYSPETGNFRIATKFKSYQYTCFQTLPLQHLMVLPYMYESKITVTPNSNVGTQSVDVKQIPTTRGFQKIKEVYVEYKSKGIIPQNFPEITISEFLARLNTLEKNLLSTFNQQDLTPLTDYKNYKFSLEQLQKYVYTTPSSFFQNYLDIKNFFILSGNNQKIYAFKKDVIETGSSTKAISEVTAYIDKYVKEMNSNPSFGVGKKYSISNTISYNTILVKNPVINYDETFKQRTGKEKDETSADFKTFKTNLDQIIESGEYYWYKFDGSSDSFMTIIENISNELDIKEKKIESDLQDRLAELLRSPSNGLGFEPTMRNLVAIIMSNAEGFLRLMSEVHVNAWSKRNDPIRTGVIYDKDKTVQSPDMKDHVDINGTNLIPVYPWPHFFIETSDQTGEKYILQYPGDPKLISKTKAYLTEIWPEVEFVEEYMRAMTKMKDNSISFDFTTISNQNQNVDRISLNSIDFPTTNRVFNNKQEVKFLFEIWERVFISAYYQRFGKDSLKSILPQIIAENESLNIEKSVGLDTPFLIQKLKQFDLNSGNYLDYLANISNQGLGDSWQKYIRDIFVTQYIENEVFNNFEILDLSYVDPNNNKINPSPEKLKTLEDYLKTTNSNIFEFTDTFPISLPQWFKTNLANGNKSSDHNNTYNTTNTLMLNSDKKVLSNFDKTTQPNQIRPITNFNYLKTDLKLPEPTEDNFAGENFKTFYKNRTNEEGLKKQLPTEGGVFYKQYFGNINEVQTTSLINTPYFTNAILEGVNNFTSGREYPYVSASFLFLNSLPLATLREKFKTYENNNDKELDYIFATIKKFGGVHKLPYAWILKYGSIWHRYKVWKNTGVDILDNCWKNFDAKENYDPIGKDEKKEYNLTIDNVQQNIVLQNTTTVAGDEILQINVGFYPKIINDFNIFCRGFGLFSNYTDSEIQSTLDSTGDSINIIYTDQSSFDKPRRYNKNNTDELLRFRTWSCILNDKKTGEKFIVPSFGSNINQVRFECFDRDKKLKVPLVNNSAVYNGSVRGMWGLPNYGYFDNSQIDKFLPDTYPKTIFRKDEQQESFSLNIGRDYTTIEELFSVFDVTSLDKMEVEFLNYSKSMYDIQIIKSGDTTISVIDITKLRIDPNTKEKNFQLMMVDLLKIDNVVLSTSKEFVKSIQEQQFRKLIKNTKSFLEFDQIMKVGNPISYNRVIFDNYSTINIVEGATQYQNYVSGSLPSLGGTTLAQSKAAYPETWKLLETYVGFSNVPRLRYSDSGSTITDFFIDGNIRFEENSVKELASLIKIYATRKYLDPKYNWTSFTNDLNKYLTQNKTFIDTTLNLLFNNLKKILPDVTESLQTSNKKPTIVSDVLPLSLWDKFKSFNDQWIAGYDYTQKCLMDDVIIIDRASRNVGDKHFFDVFKTKNRLNSYLGSATDPNVYSLIFDLFNENGFNTSLRSSYANFYGVLEPDINAVPKIEGTLEFGNEIFGIFENVDTRKTGPKLAFTLRSKSSEYLTAGQNNQIGFKSDSWEFNRVSESPLLDNLINKNDWALSNKVVAFNVDVGIRNQNMFKNISVGQESGKNTIETILANRRNIDKNSGNDFNSQTTALWDFYNSRSYQCKVASMGNAMIQVDMYFNLKHIPMFTGPYLIQEVNHKIRPGNFETDFTGVRQQMFSFPEIKNYLQGMVKDLFTSLEQRIQNQKTKESNSTQTPQDQTVGNSVVRREIISNTTVDENLECTNKLNSAYDRYIPADREQTTATPREIVDLILSQITSPGQESNRLRVMMFITMYLYSYQNNQFTSFNNNFAGAQLLINWGDNPNKKLKDEYICLISNSLNNPYAIFETKKDMLSLLQLRWQSFLAVIDENDNESLLKNWVLRWNVNPQPDSYFDNFKKNSPTEYKNLLNTVDQGRKLAKTLGLYK